MNRGGFTPAWKVLELEEGEPGKGGGKEKKMERRGGEEEGERGGGIREGESEREREGREGARVCVWFSRVQGVGSTEPRKVAKDLISKVTKPGFALGRFPEPDSMGETGLRGNRTALLESGCLLSKDKASFIPSGVLQKGQPQTSDLAGPRGLGSGASEQCLDGSVSKNHKQNSTLPATWNWGTSWG